MSKEDSRTLLSGIPEGPFDHIKGFDFWDTLTQRAKAGDQESARNLFYLATRLTKGVEELFMDTKDGSQGRKLLEDLVKSETEMPVIHSTLKFRGRKSTGEQMVEELPLGAYGGDNSTLSDMVSFELRHIWKPLFIVIREEGPDGPSAASSLKTHPELEPVIRDVSELEPLSEHNAKQWASLVANWVSIVYGTMFTDVERFWVRASGVLPEWRRRCKKVQQRRETQIADLKRQMETIEGEASGIPATKLEELEKTRLELPVLTNEMIIAGLVRNLPKRLLGP